MKFVLILALLVIAAFAKLYNPGEIYRSSEEACEILKKVLKNHDKFKKNGHLEILIVYRIESSPEFLDFTCLYSEMFVMRQIDDPKLHSQFDRPFDVSILIQDESHFKARKTFDMIKLKRVLKPNLNDETKSIFVTFTRNFDKQKLLKQVMGRNKLEEDSLIISVQSPQDEITMIYYSKDKKDWKLENWTSETLINIEKSKTKIIQTSLRSVEYSPNIKKNEKKDNGTFDYRMEMLTLDAICKTYNWTSSFTFTTSLEALFDFFKSNISDISLRNHLILKNEYAESIVIYEIDGPCFLVPINIPTSFYKNIKIPFDLPSIIMMFVSTLTTALVWKLLSANSKSKFPFSFIFMSIFKCTIGLSIEKEQKMSRKEKILLYFFIFSAILLVSFYQSVLISIMLTESKLNSIQSIQELNNSNTKIYSYLNTKNLKLREDLIINLVTQIDSLDNLYSLPHEFDPNLAYCVPRSYAETFVESSMNYRNGKKIFNILPEKISDFPTSILIRKSFPHKKEIKFVMEQLRESGIKNYWKSKSLINSKFHSSDSKSGPEFLDFKRMWFPFVVLMIGASSGMLIFICEYIMNYIYYKRSKRIIKYTQ